MELLLARVEEHAVAVEGAEILLVGLAAVVERDRVRPNVLVALALLLRVVAPVVAVPVEIRVDVVLEAAPDRRPWIGGGGGDRHRACRRPAAVVGPVAPAAGALLLPPRDVVILRPRAPHVDGLVE